MSGIRLDDAQHAPAIDREIAYLRDSGALGRASKLLDLFDYLVARSRSGNPPREVEIAQDVFGRGSQSSDDGAGRVYVHRLRRRLEEIYRDRPAAPRIALPLGEYRLVAEFSDETEKVAPAAPPVVASGRAFDWRAILLGIIAGLIVAGGAAWWLLPSPIPGWREADRARRSAIWAPVFANAKSIVVAEGDHYLFAELGAAGRAARLVRDYGIRSREELDAYLLAHPQDAERFADVGAGYVPVTVPRAQLYLSRILLAVPSVRTLPASQLPASAMLSQNIVYLGLPTGLGPLRAPVTSGARFLPGRDADVITDRRTGRVYGDAPRASDPAAPRRQYGLVSLFSGKEGNRFVVLTGSSEMGIVGLVETMADPARLTELRRALRNADTGDALYQIDSQGGGILAVRLLAAQSRDPRLVWTP